MTFADYLIAQQLAPSTVRLYVSIASRWDPYATEGYGAAGRRLALLRPADIPAAVDPHDWLAAYLTPKTPRGTHRSMCSAAFQWCAWKGQTFDSTRIPKRTKQQPTGRTGLSVDELESYYRVVEESPVDDPVYTILLLLPRTGLRVSEACNLPLDAVQTKGRRRGLHILGKGQKLRWVPLSDEAWRVLSVYKRVGRPDVIKRLAKRTDSPWMFPSPKRYAPISTGSVQTALAEIRADMDGYAAKATPHILRHTFCTNLLRKKVPLRTVQTLAGHANITTTALYLHPDADMLGDAVDLID